MKRFLLVALLLVSAASVYAADLKITGDAEVRGNMFNMAYDGDEMFKDKFFDADFNFNAALVLTENTTVFTKLTFDAETYEGTATVPDSTATDAVAMLGVERAYISTKFLPALTVDAGLMGGGMWGTAFGNTETNITRIKATYAVSDDIKVMAIYEKVYESNETTFDAGTPALGPIAGFADYDLEWTDKGDTTSYYLAANIKAGAFTVMPLFKYQVKETEVWIYNNAVKGGAPVAKSDAKPWAFTADIAATGDLGTIGFEAEVIYQMVNWDKFKTNDVAMYGAYVNVFAKLEMAKAGVALFYESADKKDGSFSAGEDFDFTLIAEDLFLENITGMMAGKLYASDIKLVDKISADVAFAYGMQTDDKLKMLDLDDNGVAETGEVTFWEVNAGVTYAIDAATSYTIEGGYANIGTELDPFTAYEVRQVIAVKF